MNEKSVLIASPIHKPRAVLEKFFDSLKRLEHDEIKLSYCFVDDNEDEESSKLINEFAKENSNVELLEVPNVYKNTNWDKEDHNWSGPKINKVAIIKNNIISYFLKGEFTHLFFVDADLILNKKTLKTLLESDKDIVSNIFWTKWSENSIEMPQVWLKDFYTLYDNHMLNPKSKEQINKETMEFLTMLRTPGIYKVGGLGACTLLKRNVLESGVNFSEIYNISFWGEDRSFCIRAVVHGFELYVNTVYPAFHIYRDKDLELIDNWVEEQEKLI